MYLGPNLGHIALIWAIIFRSRPYCLNLGHIAWIWVIWQSLGQNRPKRRQSREDEAGGTDVHIDAHT